MNKKINLYQKTIAIWNELCELHKQLHDITSEEYIYLLSGDVDMVQEKIDKKKSIIANISKIDIDRDSLVTEINKQFKCKIQNFFELNKFFSDLEIEVNNNHLSKFNSLLRELIYNIQQQNKNNQLFINKAIISLDKIKNAGAGNKAYSLYNSSGTLKK